MSGLSCAYGQCDGILFDLVKEEYYPGWGRYQRRKCPKCNRISEVPPTTLKNNEETTRWNDGNV